MLDMGFLPSHPADCAPVAAKRQTLLFSATLSKEIEALTHEFNAAEAGANRPALEPGRDGHATDL